jgi:hypothetical protein
MDTMSVAYVLCRIEDDSSLTPVNEHEDIVAAVVAGKQKVEVEDFDFSYGVYANGRRVICFAEGRIGYREWARRSRRLGDIHSLLQRISVILNHRALWMHESLFMEELRAKR